MQERYLTELENYCRQLLYLGFTPQEYLQICKIAYYAYRAQEDIADQQQHVIEWLQENPNCLIHSEEALANFWNGLHARINEAQRVIDCIDRAGFLR